LTPAAYAIWDPIQLDYMKGHLINYRHNKFDVDAQGVSYIDQLRNQAIKKILFTTNKSGLENTLICIEQGALNYYHFLIEVLPEILLMTKWCEMNNYYYNQIIVSAKSSFVNEYLLMCGIEAKVIAIRQGEIGYYNGKWEIKSMLMRNCIIGLNHFTKKRQSEKDSLDRRISLIRRSISYPYTSSSNAERFPSKIFIERMTSNNNSEERKVFPQDAFHADLITNGYEIVFLENHSVWEQIKLFSSANTIMAVHGAALANIIYMKQSATLIELAHEKGNGNLFNELALACGIENYKRIALPGVHGTSKEEEIKDRLNQGNNCLPLQYTKQLKTLIHGRF